jgi:hypothetical protein
VILAALDSRIAMRSDSAALVARVRLGLGAVLRRRLELVDSPRPRRGW